MRSSSWATSRTRSTSTTRSARRPVPIAGARGAVRRTDGQSCRRSGRGHHESRRSPDVDGSQRRRGARRHPGTRLPASRCPAVSLRRAFRGRRIPPTRADAGDRGATADVPRHVRRREPRSRRAPAPTRLVHCAGARAGSPEPTSSGRECDHRSFTVVATRRRSRQYTDRRRHRRARTRALRAAARSPRRRSSS